VQSPPSESASVWPSWLLAVLWGVGPAIPALARGDLLGQPYTDLYPSVWGMWLAAENWPGVVTHTTQLAFPEGMGFYYSSPVKGWLAGLLLPLLGLPATWNLLTVAARVATVGLSAHAARAWGLSSRGALAVAGAFGCSSVFQGYAVEGITEGVDGWPLALWAWAVARERPIFAAVGLGLCVVSSWYLGAVACLLALLATLRHRSALFSLAGLVMAAPALAGFLGAFSGGAPLAPSTRAAMGAPLRIPQPGLLPGLNPFAITTYTGAVLTLAATASKRRWLLLAVIPFVLSLGVGPWYELPILSALRFPYRWHLATLAILGLGAGQFADRHRWGWVIGPLIVLEGLLFAAVEPVLPGAPADVPALYRSVDGPVVDVPGPVALPPGEVNLSRPRARWFLYGQTLHGQATPWVPDFNAVGADTAHTDWATIAAQLQQFDRVAGGDGTGAVSQDLAGKLAAHGVEWVVIHHRSSGAVGVTRLRDHLIAGGATMQDRDDARWLLKLPPVGAPPHASAVPASPDAD